MNSHTKKYSRSMNKSPLTWKENRQLSILKEDNSSFVRIYSINTKIFFLSVVIKPDKNNSNPIQKINISTEIIKGSKCRHIL